jgi:Domain of unknown function (DUF1820)
VAYLLPHQAGAVFPAPIPSILMLRSARPQAGRPRCPSGVFGTRTSLVLDPAEEQLKSEFIGVGRSYIPMHAIIRIDEVEKEGPVKVTPIKGDGGGNVMPFPVYTQKDPGKS